LQLTINLKDLRHRLTSEQLSKESKTAIKVETDG